MDTKRNILITGGWKILCIWDTSRLISEKMVSLMYSVSANIGYIKSIIFSTQKLITITCDSYGAVIVIDANRGVVIHRFVAHHKGCNGMELLEEAGILMTWGND